MSHNLSPDVVSALEKRRHFLPITFRRHEEKAFWCEDKRRENVHIRLRKELHQSVPVLPLKQRSVRIQLEFGRFINMSMATIAKSGQLALQATLSGLVHAKCSQDR